MGQIEDLFHWVLFHGKEQLPLLLVYVGAFTPQSEGA